MVSIVIPTYNNLELLKQCVLSIENQTFQNYEVWIIDNESTDGTLDYLKTLNSPFNWVIDKDKGIYDAMNKGIDLSTKEWVYFLGADDTFYDENVLDIFLESIPDQYKLIIGNIKYHLKNSNKLYTHTKDGLLKSSWSMKLWIKNTVHHQGIFYKKELFLEESYQLKYKILADYALNLSLFLKKVRAYKTDRTIALCGAKGISKNYTKNLYREEIALKVEQSSIALKPIFVLLAIIKYTYKRIRRSQ